MTEQPTAPHEDLAPADDPHVGRTLADKYRLVELIGVGGMGRVYRAHHLGLDTQVAVKLLKTGLHTDAKAAQRFHTEARASSRLHHPNAVSVLDFGETDTGELYLVMELLRGRTLGDLLEEEGVIAGARAAGLLGQALAALDEAHAVGIVHRDFKPENVFIERLRSGAEHVRVLDFGIAKIIDEKAACLTYAGALCGTPLYTSPEQARGLVLDARSDVYAAGIVLYEMLTGTHPFVSMGGAPLRAIEVLFAHANTAPEPPRRRRPDLAISPALEAVCLRALEKDRAARPASAAAFKLELEQATFSLTDRCASCGAQRRGTSYCAECGVPWSSAIATQPASLPFCGRDAVLGALLALDRTALLLFGEPGTGKSLLLRVWTERRAAIGRRTVYIESDWPGLSPPLAPVRRAIAEVLGLERGVDAAGIARALGAHVDDRAGLEVLFAVDGPHAATPFDVRERECRAAVLAVLRRSSFDLAFDDLHRYDDPSLALLEELAALPGTATVLASASHRSAFGSGGEDVERLELAPLVAADLLQVGVCSDLVARSQGNAFVLETALRAQAEGACAPSTEARLAQLSVAARRLAELLAIAGAGLRRVIVAQILPGERHGPELVELVERGFVSTRDEPWRLTSPTLCREIGESLPVAERRVLHARLGWVLDRAQADVHAIAYHALMAGEDESGADLASPSLSPRDRIAALVRAGVAARQSFDDAAAVRALHTAFERSRVVRSEPIGE